MAHVELNVKTTVKLELSLQEAQWLKGVLQNPLPYLDCAIIKFDSEPEDQKINRSNIWHALENAGVKSS